MEFRPPDATGNAYLSMAAMLLAGIDGIQHQIDPTEAGFGPSMRIFSIGRRKNVPRLKSLPTSVESTMQALEIELRIP